jgi:hypothetical protein
MSMSLAMALQSAEPAPVPIVFGEETVSNHLHGPIPNIEVPFKAGRNYDPLSVRVTIAPDGSVTDARSAGDDRSGASPDEIARAVSVARGLHFDPFTYRGVAVAAAGRTQINIIPAMGSSWRDAAAAFPSVDYDHLKITLTRSACFGSCPDYRVTIDGTGAVEFSTTADSLPGAPEVHRAYSQWDGVLVPGTHRTTIDRSSLDALIDKFRAAHFFGLKPEYRAMITDIPSYQISFQSGGHVQTVLDYYGQHVGMPAIVSELEDAVDTAAGTARWIQGDGQTVGRLVAAGLDPKSQDAIDLAMLGARSANEQVTIDLIRAGLPLDRAMDIQGKQVSLAKVLMGAAVMEGKAGIVNVLATEGWLQRLSHDDLNSLLVSSADGCNIEIARRLIAAGADPNAIDSNDNAMGGDDTVLSNIAHGYGCHTGAHRRALMMALIALGADVNLQGKNGKSAIFGIEDPVLLDQLLAAGARADIKDKDGNSPVFGSWTDAIVLRLLDAGADPHGYYDYGGHKTLRQMAHERDMPAVLAWLDAHHVLQ